MGTIFSFYQEKMLFTEIYCHSIEFSFFSEKYVYRASLPPGPVFSFVMIYYM